MRIYPICIAPFPLDPFFRMVLVRLYGNSWKWQLLRRCFAEWIIRMDQFGEMSKTKQVVLAETSERGTAGKRTIYILYNHFNIQTTPTDKVAVNVLLGVLMVELQFGRLRMEITSSVFLLFMSVPTGRAVSGPEPRLQ